MSVYRFRVYLHSNPPLGFEPESHVWRDIEVDGEHTLADLHEGIFDAFDRFDTHGYEFLTRDEHGISTKRYTGPEFYSGDPSWPPMDDAEIDRFIDHAVPEDIDSDAKERFRNLRKNPPKEGNAANTTIDELDLELSRSLFYEFDFGDGWEHHVELEEIQEGTLDDPTVVEEEGAAPPQYPD